MIRTIIKLIWICVCLCGLTGVSYAQQKATIDKLNPIIWRTVRIKVVQRIYRIDEPYASPVLDEIQGNGLYLGHGRVLTDLELVRYGANVQVYLYGDLRARTASVRYLGYDCGLAILDVSLDNAGKNDKAGPGDIVSRDQENSSHKVVNVSTGASLEEAEHRRKLNLKLLKKGEEIPFVKIDDPTHKQIKRVDIVKLDALPFAYLDLRPGSDVTVLGHDTAGRPDRANLRFRRTAPTTLDKSDIDSHWLLQLERGAEDLQRSLNGGPLVYKGRILGIYHQNTAGTIYAIPATVIQLFLEDIKDGRYDGLGRSGLSYRLLSNPAQRRYLGLKSNEHGLEVVRVAVDAPAYAILRRGDILVTVDSKPLNQQGMLKVGDRTIGLEDYFRNRDHKKNAVQLLLVRGQKRIKVDLLPAGATRAHPGRLALQARRDYFLSGGLVFQELDYALVHNTRETLPGHLKMFYKDRLALRKNASERDVVLTGRLSDPINYGTESFQYQVVYSVNGRRIWNLKEFAAEWNRTRGKFIVIEFRGRGDRLVLPFEELKAAEKRLSVRYHVQENGRVH